MSTLDRILADIKQAMKDRDSDKLRVLRSLKSKLMEKEISSRTTGEKGELEESEIAEVLMKAAKQRKESIEQYEEGGRPELAEVERDELAIIESYLPERMSEEELRQFLKEKIEELGAEGPSDMGKVMGAVMGDLQGKADGSDVSRLVKELLAG